MSEQQLENEQEETRQESEQEESQQENKEQIDFEAEAAKEGWVSEDQWDGPGWVDAETFYKRGQEILPIVRGNLKKEREKYRQLESTVAEFRSFMNTSLENERARRKQVEEELRGLRAQAVEDGDAAAFEEADRQLEEMRQAPPQEDPVLNQWMKDNDWYGKDTAMSAYADNIGMGFRSSHPNASGKAVLDYIEEEVKREFAHKLKTPQSVDTSSRRGVSKKGNGYDDLPADAKAACDEFVSTIPGFTREEYLKTYDWS